MLDETTQARLRYLKRLELYKTEKPFQVFFDIPEDEVDQRLHNLDFEDKSCRIQDIRPHLRDYTLDEHAFAVRHQDLSLEPHLFVNREIVESRYLPTIEQLLRKEDPSIERVFFFDWRVSSSAGDTGVLESA